jgi:ABC-2 type transport system permease protein
VRLRRLLAISRKETIQLRRDARSLAMAFLMPLLLLVIFGYAITWDIRDIELAFCDQDRSAHSRALLDAFRRSGYFELVRVVNDPNEIPDLLDRKEAQIALVVPPDFARDLDRAAAAPGDPSAAPAQVQAIVDGSDANTATILLGYARATLRSFSLGVARRAVSPAGARPASPPIVAETRIWFNEELESRNMIVPGLIAVIMMIIAAMLTSLTVAREWERGTMEQLAATPVTRLEVVLGKLLPYVAIGLIDVIVGTAVGVLLFRVPFRGDPFLFLGLSLLFLLGALGLGMFISAAARSQLLATQIAMLVTLLPAFLLSGFMFAIHVMPLPLRAITYLVPARYFLVVTRGIFLKGVGVEVLWRQGLFLIVFATLGLVLAVRAFRKELA